MKTIRLWLIMILVLGVAVAGLYGYWYFFVRFTPHSLEKNQSEIVQPLERSGWVSPGLPGPPL